MLKFILYLCFWIGISGTVSGTPYFVTRDYVDYNTSVYTWDLLTMDRYFPAVEEFSISSGPVVFPNDKLLNTNWEFKIRTAKNESGEAELHLEATYTRPGVNRTNYRNPHGDYGTTSNPHSAALNSGRDVEIENLRPWDVVILNISISYKGDTVGPWTQVSTTEEKYIKVEAGHNIYRTDVTRLFKHKFVWTNFGSILKPIYVGSEETVVQFQINFVARFVSQKDNQNVIEVLNESQSPPEHERYGSTSTHGYGAHGDYDHTSRYGNTYGTTWRSQNRNNRYRYTTSRYSDYDNYETTTARY